MITSILVRTNMDSWANGAPTAKEIRRFEDAVLAACESRWPDASVFVQHLYTCGWFVPLEVETDDGTDAYDIVYAAVFDAVDRAEFEHANHATIVRTDRGEEQTEMISTLHVGLGDYPGQVVNNTDAPDGEINALLMLLGDTDDAATIDDESNEPNGCTAWALGRDYVLIREMSSSGTYFVAVNRAGWSIAHHLANWFHDGDTGYHRLSEWMAGWGFDGLEYESIASPDYEGPCYVYHEPHYRDGHINAPQPHMATVVDEDGQEVYGTDGTIIREFASYAAAEDYVSNYHNEPSGYDGIPRCNVLSPGQYRADTLTIVEAD